MSQRDYRTVRLGLLAFGLTQLAFGVWMVVAPGGFFDHWAAFGTRNEHYVRDVATISLTIGAALVWVARYPRWRVPVLAVAALQSALHTISHVVDLGEPPSGWQGPVNLAAVAGGTMTLLFLLQLARRGDQAQ
jgi:archaellum biogenesis protein FlaJ (TadC family)